MRTILTREQEVMTLGGRVQLIYELLMSHFPREEGEGDFLVFEFSNMRRMGHPGWTEARHRG